MLGVVLIAEFGSGAAAGHGLLHAGANVRGKNHINPLKKMLYTYF